MTAQRDLDKQLDAYLSQGPSELPDASFDAVRDRIEGTHQRVVIGPWRTPIMNKFVPIAVGAGALVVALVVGTRLAGPPPSTGLGGGPAASPSSAASSPSAPVAGATLSETFTSDRTGITMSYPNGWVARPGTEPWTTSVPDYLSNAGDVVHDPTRGEGNLWIAVASQPLGDATPDAWAAETIAMDDGCTATEPITIDGASGLIGADGCTRAAVTTDGRGYVIWLYTGGDDPSLPVTYDRAWFEDFLATVRLQPVAGATLSETFTSDRTGITMSYPNGWVARPGTEPWTTSVPDYLSNAGDVVHDPTRGEGNLWIAVASQPLGDATPDAWAAETIAMDDGCTATEPITIDGASGLIGADGCTRAAVTTDGRGYVIWLYTGGDDPSLPVTYDRAWFEDFLATVRLQP